MERQDFMAKLAVSFIIIKDFDNLQGALQSLLAHHQTPIQTYVVIDTGQGVQTPQMDAFSAAFPTLRYIINTQRLGFAANHNQVLRQFEEPYIALLNDDIVFQNAALDILVQYLEDHPQVGLVGPQLFNPDGTLQVSAYSQWRCAGRQQKI